MIYIIDGYNVIHTREKGYLDIEDLESRRHEFIEEIVSFIAAAGGKAVIVFDSAKAESTECRPVRDTAVTVCFGSASISADILIGKLVQEKLKETGVRIRVVSADWEVQVGTMKDRVERLNPRNFDSEMKNFAKKLANSSETDKIRWKLEQKVDEETLKKLDEIRRGNGESNEKD